LGVSVRGLFAFPALVAVVAAVACSAIGVGEIAVDSCWSSSGWGCFRCPPSRDRELLNSCGGTCERFGNEQRIPGYFGHGPDLPDGGVDTGVVEAAPPPDAGGMTACASFPNPLYITGSSALDLIWADIGAALGGTGTIVAQAKPSCAGVDAIVQRTPMTGVARAYANGKLVECALPSEGVVADVGLSDVSHRECSSSPATLPSQVADVLGPIQVFLFVAPRASTQQVISGEAAVRVFGLGSATGIKPWLHEELILRRHERSGTQIVLSKFLGLDPAQWAGQRVEGSSDIVKRLAASADPEATIAISSPDVAESPTHQSTIKLLRYQHFDQTCGYYPDSVEGAKDKKNVRAGRYALWAPVHVFTNVRGMGGEPLHPVAAALLRFLSGNGPLNATPADGYIEVLKKGRLVPSCAMRVTRDPRLSVNAPMEPYTPAIPCGCAFELADGGQSDCQRCRFDHDCPNAAPKCRAGGCEGF
jgi:hypothetical protein